MRRFTPYILVAYVSVLACLCEATQPEDWARYECIVARSPFGKKPEPAPLVSAPLVPDVNLFENIQITALIIGDSGIKVGFIDKNTQDNYLLAQGQAESGIQLVRADYDSESVLLRRNGAEQWLSMPASSAFGRAALPRHEFSLPDFDIQHLPTPPALNKPDTENTPTPATAPGGVNPDTQIRDKRQARTKAPAKVSGTKNATKTETSKVSATGDSEYTDSGSVSGEGEIDESIELFTSRDFRLVRNEDGSYTLSTADGSSVNIPAMDMDDMFLYTESGLECPIIAGNDDFTLGILNGEIIVVFNEDGTESTLVLRNNEPDDEDDDKPTVAEENIGEQGENELVYSSPDGEYQISYNEETGMYTLATPDGFVYQFTASDEVITIELPGGIKVPIIARDGTKIVVKLPGDTYGFIDTDTQDNTIPEDDPPGDDPKNNTNDVDIITLQVVNPDIIKIQVGNGSTGGNDGETKNNIPGTDDGKVDPGVDDPKKNTGGDEDVFNAIDGEPNGGKIIDIVEPEEIEEPEPEPEPDPFENLPEEIRELLLNPPMDPSPAQERILRRYRYIVPR